MWSTLRSNCSKRTVGQWLNRNLKAAKTTHGRVGHRENRDHKKWMQDKNSHRRQNFPQAYFCCCFLRVCFCLWYFFLPWFELQVQNAILFLGEDSGKSYKLNKRVQLATQRWVIQAHSCGRGPYGYIYPIHKARDCSLDFRPVDSHSWDK